MADYTGLVIGLVVVGGLYLALTGGLGDLGGAGYGDPYGTPYPGFYPGQNMASAMSPGIYPQGYPPMASMYPPTYPTAVGTYPSAYQIPGVSAFIPTPGIIAQASTDFLMPIPTCNYDNIRYSDMGALSALKIWEAGYNQLYSTVYERNLAALTRCSTLDFIYGLPIDSHFDNPFLKHIANSKRVIMDEGGRGTHDSPRANGAALNAASTIKPVFTSSQHFGKESTGGGKGIAPGGNTPSIQANSPSTIPTNAGQHSHA